MASEYNADVWGRSPDRVPGARRQKMMGYIKAANELRQSYQSQLQQMRGADERGIPGGYPDAGDVRSGDEEMVLFPSYAHRHVKRHNPGKSREFEMPGSRENFDKQKDAGDADYWRREWEKYEDANAIVDVDVRGWLYSPQKGPMSRRNRLLVAVARRLSGIPAPDQSPTGSRESSLAPSSRNRVMSHEEEAAAREADLITQRGQREADAAWKGGYSSEGARNSSRSQIRSDSPSGASTRSDDNEDPGQYSLASRMSWNLATEMNREELVKANEELMVRLRPFMTLPLTNTPITVFFYNDERSISKSIHTDESGHFNLRAALNFVPKQVRVLVSEKLSAVEDVIITETEGISLISDIDDTIKHSAIASGAREIFKNTFIKDLSDLTIQGVKEWYSKMARMGVKMHYVSNSPWQLYPLLKSYFSLAGLPHGSIHLKQYSGMLQGIFEPAAERKKNSLEKIFFDFPERKFILVGDSGEADLEVYTDIVLANPGRVLGVFIRDVTTAETRNFFDQSVSRNGSDSDVPTSAKKADDPSKRPSLPTRPSSQREKPKAPDDLIDFSDDPPAQQQTKPSPSSENDLRQLNENGNGRPQPPNKPAKPSNLRSFSTASGQSPKHDQAEEAQSPERRRPPPPPKPRRQSTSVNTRKTTPPETPQETQRPSFSSPRQNPTMPQRPGLESRTTSAYSLRGDEEGYVASARRHLNTAYNALPALRSQSPTREGSDPRAPPPPPRRGLSAYPAAAARWATGASGGDPAAGGDGGLPGAPYNKKEEFWKRRWARSEEIMRSNGVVLKTWRVGSDVMDECVRLAQDAMKDSRKRSG